MSNLNPGGLTRVLNYIKTWVTGLLNDKANSSHTHTKSQITDFPTIPTVNNGTLTIQQNGTNVQTFTANASTNATANIQCVDLSTAQTVGGQKIFTHGATGLGRDSYHFATIPYGKNTPPANTSYQYVFFSGNTASQGFTNSWYGGYIEQVVGTDGSARGRWLIRRTDETIASVELLASADNTLTFRPTNNNVMQLGDTTRAWKSIYSNAYYLGSTAFGDIVTHNASEFVDVTTVQTISGEKTFTSTPTVKKNSAGDLLYLIDDTINTSNEDENGFH